MTPTKVFFKFTALFIYIFCTSSVATALLQSTPYDEYATLLKTIDVNMGSKKLVSIKYLEVNSTEKAKRNGTILLLHGIPSSSWMYRETVDYLSEMDFHILVPDLPGFGQSPVSDDFPVTIDAYAQVIIQFMQQKQISSWSQVVHDLSGPITWVMIENSIVRQRIESLLVLNTIADGDGFHPGMETDRSLLANMASFWGALSMGKKFFKDSSAKTLSSADLEGYTRPLKALKTRRAYKELMTFVVSGKMRQALPRYQSAMSQYQGEVAILWGLQDDVLHHSQISKIEALFPNHRHSLCLKNGRHYVNEDGAFDIALAMGLMKENLPLTTVYGSYFQCQ